MSNNPRQALPLLSLVNSWGLCLLLVVVLAIGTARLSRCLVKWDIWHRGWQLVEFLEADSQPMVRSGYADTESLGPMKARLYHSLDIDDVRALIDDSDMHPLGERLKQLRNLYVILERLNMFQDSQFAEDHKAPQEFTQGLEFQALINTLRGALEHFESMPRESQLTRDFYKGLTAQFDNIYANPTLIGWLGMERFLEEGREAREGRYGSPGEALRARLHCFLKQVRRAQKEPAKGFFKRSRLEWEKHLTGQVNSQLHSLVQSKDMERLRLEAAATVRARFNQQWPVLRWYLRRGYTELRLVPAEAEAPAFVYGQLRALFKENAVIEKWLRLHLSGCSPVNLPLTMIAVNSQTVETTPEVVRGAHLGNMGRNTITESEDGGLNVENIQCFLVHEDLVREQSEAKTLMKWAAFLNPGGLSLPFLTCFTTRLWVRDFDTRRQSKPSLNPESLTTETQVAVSENWRFLFKRDQLPGVIRYKAPDRLIHQLKHATMKANRRLAVQLLSPHGE